MGCSMNGSGSSFEAALWLSQERPTQLKLVWHAVMIHWDNKRIGALDQKYVTAPSVTCPLTIARVCRIPSTRFTLKIRWENHFANDICWPR